MREYAGRVSDAFDAVGGVSPGWLVLGVALHLLNQVARGCGWHAVVRGAGAAVRRRDVVAAWVAGAGAGGIVSARGGDAVRLLVLARRAPGTGCALLTGTLVAETVGETALGAALLALGLAVGIGPHLGGSATTALYVLAALGCAAALACTPRVRRIAARGHAWAAAVAWRPTARGWAPLARAGAGARGCAPLAVDGAAPALHSTVHRWALPARLGAAARRLAPARLRRVGRAVRRFVRGAARGCAPLRRPGAYARAVLPWQVASRALRLAALACFLAAFHLPATPAAVLLIVFAQTSGRLLPFSLASVGAGAAILAATFEPVTGTAVPPGQLAACFVGTSTVLTVIGSALAVAICVQASARMRPTRPFTLGRFTRIRAATAPRP